MGEFCRNDPRRNSSASSRTTSRVSESTSVRFCEYGDSALDSEQPADIEVLAGLRLDAFVGGDDQQHQINSADPGQHVADEALVAGNVDETDANRSFLGPGNSR